MDNVESVVGHFFRGVGGKVYFCDSYDPQIGFWMTNIEMPIVDRRNVSERAIGRTYHQIESETKEYERAKVIWTRSGSK